MSALITDREGKPVCLYVVTVERTYSCDFVVAAPNAEQARKEAQHARSPGVPRCTILEILGPQESAEERASRLHNEQMAKLQGVLF